MTQGEASQIIMETLAIEADEAELILEKAEIGGEFEDFTQIEPWLTQRFLPNCVTINQDEYTRMCVDALKIVGGTAATDYGSSRQRDFGQLWADMTRGYLGEFAFQKTLKDRWRIEAELGHEVGNLTEYLPLDIHQIRRDGEAARAPRLKISIKTTKWNGIWLDIPGDQFDHSDIHVLVKIGAGRDHLFGFFKSISVFRDKILLRGQEVGALSALEAGVLYDALPSFRPVSAYVSGFVRKDDNFENLPYGGRAGTKNFTVSSWNGPIRVGDLDAIKEQEGIRGTVRFAGIGEFSHDSGYLFNVGSLRWTEAQWREVIDAL